MDEFDFLIFVTSLYQFEDQRLLHYHSRTKNFNPTYFPVSNDVEGIGLPISSNSKSGSSGRLQGMIRLASYRMMAHRGVVSHELMHRWANYIIPSSSGGHWGFSSANGIVGGFDIADLIDLGEGQFAVRGVYRGGGTFNKDGHGPDRYSPIELYLAGLMPAEEVPDIWVGEDVEWARDQAGKVPLAQGKYRIFKPGRVSTYTIEDVIAEHGKRVPDASQSQRDFRAAVIMLIDKNHPATRRQLDLLSVYVAKYGCPGIIGSRSDNFDLVTGGRAKIAMGRLSDFLKSAESRGTSSGTPGGGVSTAGCPKAPSAPVFPWTQDGLTDIERETLGYLKVMQFNLPALVEEILEEPWLRDGIVERERKLLCILSTVWESRAAYAFLRASVSPGASQLPSGGSRNSCP